MSLSSLFAKTAPSVLKMETAHFVRPIMSCCCSVTTGCSKKHPQLWCMPWCFTHPHSQIYSLSFTHCLSLAPSVLLLQFILTACLCFSPPASRWLCGGVNRDSIPAVLFFTHTWEVGIAGAPVLPGKSEVSPANEHSSSQTCCISHSSAHLCYFTHLPHTSHTVLLQTQSWGRCRSVFDSLGEH